MSGALVSTSTDFQQGGSVDWVELSGRSNFPVVVLARLFEACMDPFTLPGWSSYLHQLFPLLKGRGAQKVRISWRHHLSRFSVKHVVTDLVETTQTEEGPPRLLQYALSTTDNLQYGSTCTERAMRSLQGRSVLFRQLSGNGRDSTSLVLVFRSSGHFVP